MALGIGSLLTRNARSQQRGQVGEKRRTGHDASAGAAAVPHVWGGGLTTPDQEARDHQPAFVQARSVPGQKRPPRRTPIEQMLFRLRRRAPQIALLILGIGVPAALIATGWVGRQWDAAGDGLARSLSDAGLSVHSIVVIGRGETESRLIVDALDIKHGDPILTLDPAEARDRVEALPWVRSAIVDRQLPDKVVIEIEERVALAIWQEDGRFSVIDQDGEEIMGAAVEDHRHLPQVVGSEAPHHTVELFGMLSREPALWSRVKAAVWVGDRRWNIRLEADKGDIDVQLPEDDPEAAWVELAKLQHDQQILARAISGIDMRLADRIIMRRGTGKGSAIALDELPSRPTPSVPLRKPRRQTAQGD